MAESPAHKFGQIVGNLIEAVVEPFLSQFAKELGGMQVQFNVADAAVLREAQTEPEKHRNLTVRLWGFPAYFTRLPKEFQDHIIARTELAL